MSEPEPIATKEMFIDQKPFVIRGHHLMQYISLLKDTLSPAEHAREDRKTLKEIQALDPKLVMRSGNIVEAEHWIKHGKDVVGLSVNDANTYENNIRTIFEKFLSLPDDHPAEITEGLPDAICSACINGEHCRLLRSPINNEDVGIRGDGKYLDAFMETLQNFHLPQPAIIFEEAHFSDAEPQKVRTIKTTMGTVRKALIESTQTYWRVVTLTK